MSATSMLVHSSVTPITYRKRGDVATVVHREFLLECCDVVLRTQRSALHGYAGRPGDQTTPQVSHQGARKADQAKGSGRWPKPVCRSKICGVSPTEPHRRPKGQTQPQPAQQEKGGHPDAHIQEVTGPIPVMQVSSIGWGFLPVLLREPWVKIFTLRGSRQYLALMGINCPSRSHFQNPSMLMPTSSQSCQYRRMVRPFDDLYSLYCIVTGNRIFIVTV